MTSAFAKRWLLFSGLPASKAEETTATALQRARRYDFPFRSLYFIFLGTIEWIAPLLLLGKFSRASSLTDTDLDLLLKKLGGGRFHWARAFLTLILLPLMERLKEDHVPAAPPHPLAKIPPPVRLEFDYVIVGSGAGGAPVAAELSRRGLRVAVIEKGGLPVTEEVPKIFEHYYASQTLLASFKKGITVLVAGSAVGGTTVINSGTCLRPFPSAMTVWQEKTGLPFSDRLLDRWMDQVESRLGVTIPPRELMSHSSRLFEQGMMNLGRKGTYLLPRNAPGCQGSGRCCFVCPTGAKKGTDLAYLPEAAQSGAELFIKTTATRIREERDSVVVETSGAAGRRLLRARQLVLAGGALSTPGLIRKNRLGSRWRLAGNHLKIHPAAKVLAYFPDLNHGERGVPQGVGYRPPEYPRLTLEGIHVPKVVLGPMVAATGHRFRWWMQESDHLASFGMFVQDRQAGRVRNWGSFPYIDYRLHPDDARDLSAGLLLAAEAFLAAGATRVLLPSFAIEKEPTSPAELKKIRPEDFRRDSLVVSGFHPMGTAAIGVLVDQDLRLIGSQRIYVCDASVFPDSPGVNPMVTIMALSLRLAEHLAA